MPVKSIKKSLKLSKILGRTFRDTMRANGLVKSGKMTRDWLDQAIVSWSQDILAHAGVNVEVTGEKLSDEPVLLVGNHMSYLDIPVVASVAPVSFVAKSEVSKWPFFGSIAHVGGTIFVDRKCKNSRAEVGAAIADAITNKRRNVVVFPEGTSSILGKDWRFGSFQMAEKYGFKVQAFRISYSPVREAAYIDDDVLVPHLWRLFEMKVKAEVEFSEPVAVKDAIKACEELQSWNRTSLHKRLKELGWSI